ncbi:MAG TPA: YihY/virulence factor BrkB family protein [Polyangia bacterium]|nr:YihY/virulence factor BrkB family protein [Polyangia bacterium]
MDPRRTYERARHFFETRIWSTRLEHAGRGRVLLYRFGRAAYATARGFFDKELTSRAASLTYYSMLSVVPFLAFAFSILKGFGVYHELIATSVRPYLRDTFADDKSLLAAIDQVFAFVERTSVSGLSVIGVLLLVYTSISMLSTIETALNEIWEVKSARSLRRKLTDYTTILVIGPLLVLAAITISTAAQNSSFVAWLHGSLLLGGVTDLLLRLTSLVLGSLGLVAVYLIMPNTRVRLASAIFGGVVAGVLWHLALLLHVKFQVGVARYNALYSGFAALPIFLVWLYLSWNILLVGAALAASHQYEQRMRQAVRARHVDQELREALAVVVAAAVSRSFIDGHAAPTSVSLAQALEVPAPAVEQVLDTLVRAGLLVRVSQEGEARYDPARDVDAVHMIDVEEAMRHDPSAEAEAFRSTLERTIGPELGGVLRARHDEGWNEAGMVTLRELARRCPPRIDGVTQASRTPSPADAPGPRAPRKPDA